MCMIISRVNSNNNCRNVNFNAKLKLTPNKVVKMLPYSISGAMSALGASQVINADSVLNEDLYGKQMLKETEIYGYSSMIMAPSFGVTASKVLDDMEIDIKSNKDLPS